MISNFKSLKSAISNAKTVYMVGTDPVGDGEALPAARDAFVIVQELFMTETAKRADVVLPAVSFAERDGTYTNAERRVQRFYAALPVTVDARPDWEIFWDIGRRMGMDWRYTTAEEVMEELARSVPAYAGMTYARLMQTQAQWPPVGAQDLYFGGTAYDNRGGLGAQYPAACETMERFAVAWAEPPAPPAARGNIIAVPVRRLYHRGTLIAQPLKRRSHMLDSRTLAPCIELCQRRRRPAGHCRWRRGDGDAALRRARDDGARGRAGSARRGAGARSHHDEYHVDECEQKVRGRDARGCHMHFVRDVSYVSEYKLLLSFEDGSVRLVDLEREMDGEIFEPLADINYFKTVRVNPDLDTIVWDNGADMSPDFLYEIGVAATERALAA